MSRDWTPEEHFLTSEYLKKEQGVDIFQMALNTNWVKGEKKTPFFPDIKISLSELYPNCIHYAFADGEGTKLLLKMSENEFIRDFFLSELESNIESLKMRISPASFIYKDDTLTKWWKGELDPNFYYDEINSSLFTEYLDNIHSQFVEKYTLFLNTINDEKLKKDNWLSFFSAYNRFLYREHGAGYSNVFELMNDFDPAKPVGLAYTQVTSERTDALYEWNVYYSFMDQKQWVSLNDYEIKDKTILGMTLNDLMDELSNAVLDINDYTNYFGCESLIEEYEDEILHIYSDEVGEECE